MTMMMMILQWVECDSHSYLDLSVAQKQELAFASVIIWDEASMVADVTADCVNRSLQDILGSSVAFGGMPVVICAVETSDNCCL